MEAARVNLSKRHSLTPAPSGAPLEPLWSPSGAPLEPLWSPSGPPMDPLWTPCLGNSILLGFEFGCGLCDTPSPLCHTGTLAHCHTVTLAH
eukprot:1191739-Prorocentrum_minimum.AAC.2